MHSRNDDRRPARLTANFEGRVQGVGFRFTVLELASRTSAVGYVRNDPDSSVTVVAEAPRVELDALLNSIRASGLGQFICREHLGWGPALGDFDTFEVRYF